MIAFAKRRICHLVFVIWYLPGLLLEFCAAALLAPMLTTNCAGYSTVGGEPTALAAGFSRENVNSCTPAASAVGSQIVFARRSARPGFSLLEVIIATAILAASGVMLMSMFSTGDRHTRRADQRTIAQMLCQSKLEELLANPSLMLPIEADVFRQYPGWVYSVGLQPTALDRFVQLTISVTHIPGTETGANLDLATTASAEQTMDVSSISNLPEQPTFKLVRWLEFDGDVSGFASDAASSFGSRGF